MISLNSSRMKNFGYIFNADIGIFSLIKQKNELLSITYGLSYKKCDITCTISDMLLYIWNINQDVFFTICFATLRKCIINNILMIWFMFFSYITQDSYQ